MPCERCNAQVAEPLSRAGWCPACEKAYDTWVRRRASRLGRDLRAAVPHLAPAPPPVPRRCGDAARVPAVPACSVTASRIPDPDPDRINAKTRKREEPERKGRG